MGDGERTARMYDAMAQSYAAHNAASAYNAYYERPATKDLVGDVAGLDVLEVGCGSGPLTVWLLDQGANVTAMDVSPGMALLAQETVGERAEVRVADLAEPLSFADDAAFDLVVASLVLHYLRDWEPALREFRRVLRPSGHVVFSTHHPFGGWKPGTDDYYSTQEITELWPLDGQQVPVTFWRRPLRSMVEVIRESGFVLQQILEPPPAPELEQHDPVSFRTLTTEPAFLFFRLALESA